MKRGTLLSLLAGLVTVAVSASPAWAQAVVGIERGKFDAVIGGGAILHQNASAIQSVSPVINFKGRFYATENIGLGFSLDYARTETDDDIFPLGQFSFGTADSTIFVALKQPISLFHYQFQGTFGTNLGSIYPYLSAGIGGYTIYMDPQQNDGPVRQSDLLLSFGGAFKLGLTSATAIEVAVRDVIYTDFNRDDLNPIPDRTCRVSGDKQFSGTTCPNERFPFLDPERSDPDFSGPESTIHNIVITASFSFIPGL